MVISVQRQSRGFTWARGGGLHQLTPFPSKSGETLRGRINWWALSLKSRRGSLPWPGQNRRGLRGRKRNAETRIQGGDARGPRGRFPEPELTDAKSYDQAAGEQGLLAVRRSQHRGAGGEERAGQQDGGPAAEDAVEGAAGQRRDGGRPHRAGHQQLLPQRVQAELPLEQQHGPRHHPGVIAEQEAAQRGEDRHHVHEGGGLVLLELLPRRALQVPDAAARARTLQAAARLGGRQEAALAGRARRVRLLLLPAPLALEAAQTPQRVLHILARLAGHRAAGARGFPGGRGSAGRRPWRAGQPVLAGATAAAFLRPVPALDATAAAAAPTAPGRKLLPAETRRRGVGTWRVSLETHAPLLPSWRCGAGGRRDRGSRAARDTRGGAPGMPRPLPGRGRVQPAPNPTPRSRATFEERGCFN